MPYSFTSTVAAALLRVQNFYNGLSYDPSSNPGGYDQDGHRVNFVPTLRDIATIGGGFAQAGTDIQGYLGSAQQAVTDAQGKVDLAAIQASNAMTSATASYTARLGSEGALASFMQRYLGAKSADPTLDNAGNALIVGAEYWATQLTPPRKRIWTGSAWADGVTVTAGVSSFKGRTGAVTPVANDYAVADISGLATALEGKLDVSLKATGANLRALTDDAKYLTAKAHADAIATAALGNITGTLALDFAASGFNPSGIATGNLTLGQHTNIVDQKPVSLEIVQDGTGSRTIAANTTYNKFVGGAVFTLSTAAGARDILYGTGRVIGGVSLVHWTGFAKDVK